MRLIIFSINPIESFFYFSLLVALALFFGFSIYRAMKPDTIFIR